MQTSLVLVVGIVLSIGFAPGASRAATSPMPQSSTAEFIAAEAWAFPVPQSRDPSAPRAKPVSQSDPYELVHVPGSTRSYTAERIESDFDAPDWFPQDHPPMPHVVQYGRKPTMACAVCHQANGRGDPASASLAGLPETYILEQIGAFRNGERGGESPPTNNPMPEEARDLNAADLQQAGAYFSSLKVHPATQVVETTSVPQTHWHDFVRVPNQNGARELLGERIIEVPVSIALYDAGDGRSGFIAYVPRGSVERGAAIATQGVGTAASCVSCHGADLQGEGNTPYLASRSPTYIVRELILFRLGERINPQAAPMRVEASQLTLRDMIDVAAYAASRKPRTFESKETGP